MSLGPGYRYVKMPVPARKLFGLKWPCFRTGNRAVFGQMVFVPDENLKHISSTACRPGVFQIALFEGFPNIPIYPPLPDTQRAQIRQQWQRPRKTLCVGMIPTDPETYARCICPSVLYSATCTICST